MLQQKHTQWIFPPTPQKTWICLRRFAWYHWIHHPFSPPFQGESFWVTLREASVANPKKHINIFHQICSTPIFILDVFRQIPMTKTNLLFCPPDMFQPTNQPDTPRNAFCELRHPIFSRLIEDLGPMETWICLSEGSWGDWKI